MFKLILNKIKIIKLILILKNNIYLFNNQNNTFKIIVNSKLYNLNLTIKNNKRI